MMKAQAIMRDTEMITGRYLILSVSKTFPSSGFTKLMMRSNKLKNARMPTITRGKSKPKEVKLPDSIKK
jgi:hypothetical protein